jgi:hypothetical protein
MLVLRSFVIAISIVFVGFTGAQASSMDFTLDELVAEGSASCKGDFTLDDDAVQRFDFNSDGEDELVILDESGFSCEDSASMYCGTAGCIVHFITSADYTYGYTRGWQIVRTKSDQPIILLELHGLSCGEVGTTPCYEAVSIFEGRFIGRAK